MSYTIAFDFPERDDPVFASISRDGLGFTPLLSAAIKFSEFDGAQRTLDGGYRIETRRYGAVVEVGK